MASKLMEARLAQKAYWEKTLEARIESLKEAGADETTQQKDPVVRKIKARIRETASRLRAIAAKEEKIKEMARIREEKRLAALESKKEKKKTAEPEEPKKGKKAKPEQQAKAPKEQKKAKAPKGPKAPKAEEEAKAPEGAAPESPDAEA